MIIRAPAARLLTRAVRGGRGFKSRPLGASILPFGEFELAGEGSGFWFTVDLDLARFLSATENQFGPFE
jgi:hypothetical protein